MAENFIDAAGSSMDPYARSTPPPSSNRYERQAPATSYHSYARPSPPRSSGLYGQDQSQALYTSARDSYDSTPPPRHSERQASSASRDAPVNLVGQYEAPRPVVSSLSSRDRQSAASLARDGGFTVTSDGYLAAYCDGSSRNNGRTQAKAGLGVYWGDSREARQRYLGFSIIPFLVFRGFAHQRPLWLVLVQKLVRSIAGCCANQQSRRVASEPCREIIAA